MNTRRKKALRVLAVLLAFSLAQVYVQASLPVPAAPSAPQGIAARLTVSGGGSATVNGISAGTGATILTGATIEVPDQVGATIDLGDGGVIELQPGSKIQLDFDANGNVRVKVIRGCAAARKKTNVLPGEIEMYTDTASEKTDKKRRNMGFCFLPNGGLGPLPTPGLSGAAIGGIIGGGIGGGVVLGTVLRGGNPSPNN
jgi:hypothetical protein